MPLLAGGGHVAAQGQERLRAGQGAPAAEIFCCSFTMRRSRSAWLLSNGTRRSVQQPQHLARGGSSRRASRLAAWARRRVRRRRPVAGGGGLAASPRRASPGSGRAAARAAASSRPAPAAQARSDRPLGVDQQLGHAGGPGPLPRHLGHPLQLAQAVGAARAWGPAGSASTAPSRRAPPPRRSRAAPRPAPSPALPRLACTVNRLSRLVEAEWSQCSRPATRAPVSSKWATGAPPAARARPR